ncbi:UDP-N-acetylmuramoylalanyl-D-glutamate--2,6-diaminopimelate ligase [Salinicoccus sp. ID82-1]|uniref:Mur ligase family protein n=1 Tax=Salinicoccus sp. ID82-1 TaxID=2820269 RepID=UPI001EFF4F28|nr:Mur ligase family protein [Salinicoccus sp. ID82-1]MCG1010137.1 UDP-N-acetylmuramoylalanyl-D-glutamate--2,6-diaminopimelate ligase [Salinicoccus sp. ID82-1]
MKVFEVIEAIKENISNHNFSEPVHTQSEVYGITSMYQNLRAGDVFMLKASGNSGKYLEAALEYAPGLIITDFKADAFKAFHNQVDIIYIRNYNDVSIRMVELFYGKHMNQLKYIAVTGTNGKTTTSHFIGRLLSELGLKVATVGTLGIFDHTYEKVVFTHSTPTTPMHFEFAEVIKYFALRDYDYIVYEATSIALDQRRTDFISNEIGVFNNFSPEHLDYHKTMENYLASKLKLASLSEQCLVNADVPEYRSIMDDSYHFSKHQDTYYRFRTDIDHIDLRVGAAHYTVKPRFLGEHNYINLATSIFTLLKLGYDVDAVIDASRKISPPVHRFELFSKNTYDFILDFAHTPIAINESIINAMKYAEKVDKKLIVMVTGIGLRGYEKIRMTMEMVPENLHRLVLAAEQVGYEDEYEILKMMQSSLPESYDETNTITAISRQEGIVQAINHADDASVILLTGINEPQHYRGELLAHDDKAFIFSYLDK